MNIPPIASPAPAQRGPIIASPGMLDPGQLSPFGIAPPGPLPSAISRIGGPSLAASTLATPRIASPGLPSRAYNIPGITPPTTPTPRFAAPGPEPRGYNIPGISAPANTQPSTTLRSPGIASPARPPASLMPFGTSNGPAPLIATPTVGESPNALALRQSKEAEAAIKPPSYSGKLGVLEKIGDVAGRLLAPGIEQRLGVGTIGYQQRLAQAEGQTDRLEKQQATEAATDKAQADAQLETANANKVSGERPPEPAPDVQAFDALVKQGVDPVDAFRQVTQAGTKPTPQHLEHVTLTGPDGKPMQANYDAATGKYTDSGGQPIANPTPYTAPKSQSAYEDLKKEHPNWTVEQIEQAMAKPSFPRIEPVNDAQGNVLGYNYLEGTPGGGVVMKFIKADAGGAPTVGGVIPPKPTAGTLGMEQMARMTQAQIPPLQAEVQQLAAKLGPAVGRWNDYMVGTVGTDDPDFAGLKEDLKLFASAVVRTHFGARGGEKYINALESDFSAAQSPADLQARIAHAGGWIQGYANGAGLSRAGGPGSPANGPKTVTQAELAAVAKSAYGGNIKKAEAAAKAQGYTIHE